MHGLDEGDRTKAEQVAAAHVPPPPPPAPEDEFAKAVNAVDTSKITDAATKELYARGLGGVRVQVREASDPVWALPVVGEDAPAAQRA